jgi:glutamine amidotransferase
MCRFTLYLGPPITLKSLITDPVNSIIHQSYHSLETAERLNGDGFGIAWYVPELSHEPAIFRSISPAWNNHNLLHLARVTTSPCVLAHVRAATPGLPVSEANCHPFCHGSLSFMHNGHIGGFRKLRRRIVDALSNESFEAIHGSTDTEHLFALFLDEYRAREGASPGDRLGAALQAAIKKVLLLVADAGITDHSYFNVGVADGSAAAVMRCSTDTAKNTDSLFLNRGRRYECIGGICRMLDPATDDGPQTVMVSSERLSADHSWERVPENTMIVIGPDRRVRIMDAVPG